MKEFGQQKILGQINETVSESLKRQQIAEEIKKNLAMNEKKFSNLMRALDKKVVVDVKSSRIEMNIEKIHKMLADNWEAAQQEIVERMLSINF